VEKANPKRLHSVRFHYETFFRMKKILADKDRFSDVNKIKTGADGKQVDKVIKGCGVGNIQYFYYGGKYKNLHR
jgi:hypothetical protein